MNCTTLLADRLQMGGTDYKFGMMKAAKQEVLDALSDPHGLNRLPLLDLGIGESDQPADPEIISVLINEAGKKENRTYTDNGIPAFLQAAAGYMKEVFGVGNLDPTRNILHGIGSKSILSLLPYCLINPGDIVLMPVPGYPVLGTHVTYLGGKIYPLPLKSENQYLPDLRQIPEEICQKSKMLYLNYPANPTGATASKAFYEQVISFAERYKIIVVQDAAYAAITYEEEAPLSFLSVPGARNVGVEIHSLSKAFSMTGWRLAFLAGNESIIKAYGQVKGNSDSGQFAPIQLAGSYALSHPEITRTICTRLERRMDLLVSVLSSAGFMAVKPKAGYYCYVPAPFGAGAMRFHSAAQAASYLLRTAHIATIPWDEAGSFLRFSVTWDSGERTDEEIAEELKCRLLSLRLNFSL